LQDFSASPLIDREQFEMLVETGEDDARGMLTELMGLFTGEAEPKFVELNKCAAEMDRYKCSRIAHALAGASGNLGCLRLSQMCRAYEHASNGTPGLSQEELVKGALDIAATYRISVEAMSVEIEKIGK
ncbi:MAG TPA: Hpt domain-containing protein, partial [Opitutales bacterium]|nr:Hpt domain-containing protein [Opitutales bacterium]